MGMVNKPILSLMNEEAFNEILRNNGLDPYNNSAQLLQVQQYNNVYPFEMEGKLSQQRFKEILDQCNAMQVRSAKEVSIPMICQTQLTVQNAVQVNKLVLYSLCPCCVANPLKGLQARTAEVAGTAQMAQEKLKADILALVSTIDSELSSRETVRGLHFRIDPNFTYLEFYCSQGWTE